MTAPVTTSPVVEAIRDAVAAVMTGSLSDVAVIDAMSFQQVTKNKTVTVAGTWDPDTGDVTSPDAVTVETLETGAGRRSVETTTVDCIAYSGAGGFDLATRRAEVNDILTGVRAALWGLSTVGGASARAQMTAQQWAQIADTQGVGVIAAFVVVVAVLP